MKTMTTVLFDLVDHKRLSDRDARWFADCRKQASKVLSGSNLENHYQALLENCLVEEREIES